MRELGRSAIGRFLRLIRFSHTIFALPFALGALVAAANGLPSVRVLALVVLCMVFARTAAMLFNRLADWSLDQRNPRTAYRHLLLSKSSVSALLVLSSAGFVMAAAAINSLTLPLRWPSFSSTRLPNASPAPRIFFSGWRWLWRRWARGSRRLEALIWRRLFWPPASSAGWRDSISFTPRRITISTDAKEFARWW